MKIYFTRYVHSKSIKIISLHYLEIMGKIKEHDGKKHLTVHNCMPDKLLGKIKETMGIVKCDKTKILIDTDDNLPGCNTLNVVTLMTCVIKNGKFYFSILLEE